MLYATFSNFLCSLPTCFQLLLYNWCIIDSLLKKQDTPKVSVNSARPALCTPTCA